jgi:PEP-CTERM motif-containing protein
MRKLLVPLLTVVIVAVVVSAGASVVTSIPGGTVIPMPAVNYFGPGPQTFGPGITWSSTNEFNQGGSVFGFTPGACPSDCYSFLGNGSWVGGLGPMAGLNDSTDIDGVTDTMTFAFATPVGAVGGFLNYVPGSSNPTTIAVWDSLGNLIEPAFALTFLTGGGNDTGAFYGFQESTANISYFTLTDNFIGITNLTTGPPSSVPEPGSLLLVGTGLLGAISYGRRRLGL